MKLLALEISTSSSKAQYLDTTTGESTLLVERNPSSNDVEVLCMHVIQLGKRVAKAEWLTGLPLRERGIAWWCAIQTMCLYSHLLTGRMFLDVLLQRA